MKKILLISTRELHQYLSTWMGYIIIAAALFLDGILFNAFAIGQSQKFSADVLSDYFYFASGMSMVAGIFLAMRLIAEEKQTGSIVLFYTSPVSERQLVYGKFLSALMFSFILHIISLYLPGLIFLHGKVSIGHIAAGYLNLMLIGASTMAITLFASALAPNQLIAAITGSLFTVTLLVVWMLAEVVDEPIKGILSYIALHNKHFTSFSKGIINVSDVVYYLSVILFFLECSVRVLESRRVKG